MNGMPKTPTLTVTELLDTPGGENVNVAIEILSATDDFIAGHVIEPDTSDPFTHYHRADHYLAVHWSADTKVVMGTRANVTAGEPVWVTGVLRDDDTVDARLLAPLTQYARVS